MTDIVDAFVVSLGLDPTEYNDEMKKYREDRKRLASEDEQYDRRQQNSQRKTADGFRAIRNEVGGFLLLLAGANSLKNFVGDMLTGDAATGRFAANMGMATERVSVWENAIKQVGGSAQEAQGSIRALSNIFQEYQLLGDNSRGGDLAFFGLSERDLKNPDDALMKLAERGEGLKGDRRAEFTMRLNRLGLNDSMVTLLSKGRKPLEEMLDAIEKNGVATDESALAAQNLEAELAKTAQTLQGVARPAISDLAKELTTLTGIVRDLIAPLGQVREWLQWFSGSNVGKMGGGADYKNAWDYVGDALGGGVGGWIKDNMGAEGKGGASAGAGGGGKPVWGAGNVRSASGRPVSAETLRLINGGAPASTGGSTRRGKLTRAERNNNPGNIEDGPFARRQPGYVGGDGRFAKFATADAGFAAMETLLLGRGYMGGGRNTISSIISKYAPSSENNVGAYASAVERSTGINRNATLTAAQIRAVSRAMAKHEGYRGGSVDVGGGGPTVPFTGFQLRQPAGGARSTKVSQSSTTTIGQVTIYTPAANAEGIARDLRGELAKRDMVVQGTSGLKS